MKIAQICLVDGEKFMKGDPSDNVPACWGVYVRTEPPQSDLHIARGTLRGRPVFVMRARHGGVGLLIFDGEALPVVEVGDEIEGLL